MKKLLNTLFVTSDDCALSLDGENVVVKRKGQNAARFPLHTLDGIISFSYFGATPALMGACGERNVSLSFMTPTGKFLARSIGRTNGNVLLRRKQYRLADTEGDSRKLATWFISAKIYNSRWVIERATRDHALRLDTVLLKQISSFLKNSLDNIQGCSSLAQVRGIEGEAAVQYFRALNEMILQNKTVFEMKTRTRRPPQDAMNALLSFLYTLLSHDCASALEAVGLDSYVGFLHQDRPGRQSLALDFMEELRPVFADRLALTLINRQELNAGHFTTEPTGGVFLNDEGRKIVLSAWQGKKRDEITHPYLGEKIQWGMVPYIQALLLARFIRGDIDAYPPFFWK